MKHIKLKLALLTSLGMAASALASTTTIDFESTPTGIYSSLTYDSVTITFLGGTGFFDVADATPGPPISAHNVLSFFQNPGSDSFQATFGPNVTSVSIGMGDFNADDDEGNLRAYDAANNLLGSDFILVPSDVYGGGTLSVSSATPIARVEWNETGSFAGAVYWDNLTYTTTDANVPDSGSFGVMVLSLGLLGIARRQAN